MRSGAELGARRPVGASTRPVVVARRGPRLRVGLGAGFTIGLGVGFYLGARNGDEGIKRVQTVGRQMRRAVRRVRGARHPVSTIIHSDE